MERKIKIALIQYEIGADWGVNISKAGALLEKAKEYGADLAVLPEMFMCPYDLQAFPKFAEKIPDGRTCRKLQGWSRELGLHLVGGSIPEEDDEGRIFNTATLWDGQGNLLATHRKVHLFDVDLPGGVSFQESKVFAPGEKMTVVDVLGLRLGLAVCYDVRFPELFRLMALAGAEVVALPGAFNNVSGPHHWEMSLRARAVENTVYMAGVSGTAPPGSSYDSWGHSMVVDPFGEILVELGRAEGLGLAEIDPARLKDVRSRLPLLVQRRDDLYDLRLKKEPNKS